MNNFIFSLIGILSIFVFLILLFVRKNVFKEWRKVIFTLPFLYLILLFFLEPVPNGISIINILFVGVSSALFLSMFQRKHKIQNALKHYSYFYVIIICFFLWGLISSIVAYNTLSVTIEQMIRSIIPFLFLLLVFPISFYLKNEQSLKIITAGVGAASGLYSLKNLYYFFSSGIEHGFSNVLIYRITLLDPATTVPLTVFAAIIYFFFFILSAQKKKWFFLLFVLNFSGAAVTLTRSMIISICLSIAFFSVFIYFIKYYKHIRKLFWKMGTLLFLIFTLVLLIPSPIRSLLQAIITRFQKASQGDVNVSVRFKEYMDAFKIFNEHPLLGGGLGVRVTEHGGEMVNYIHNVTFYMLANVGIIGLILYVMIFFVVFFSYKNKNIYALSYSAALFGLFIYSQFFATFRLIHHNVLIAFSIAVICFSSSLIETSEGGETNVQK